MSNMFDLAVVFKQLGLFSAKINSPGSIVLVWLFMQSGNGDIPLIINYSEENHLQF